MKRNIIFILTLYLFLASCSSNKEIFAPKELVVNPLVSVFSGKSQSVVRNSETVIEVKNSSETYFTVKKAITIFEKENKDIGQLVLGYSPLVELKYVNANITDKNGNVVKSFSMDDAKDFSSYDGFSFFSDNRVKVLDLFHNSFPYTIQYEFQKKYNGTLFLPTWIPQQLEQTVQKASLTVIDETGGGVRYHSENLNIEPNVQYLDGAKVMNWEVGLLGARERESYGPSALEVLPIVRLAPSYFEIENTEGNAETWENFGKWYYELGKDAKSLSKAAKTEIDNIIADKATEQEKVNALFRYMQNKTRYVSIQLGIGGWKPFPAEYVFTNEYGDCKALTNYMQSILEYAGIKSNAVLINSGISEAPLRVDFPSNQFNHVILRVELSNGEIIWLECTSKYYPPGHIGSGNEDKNALMVTKEGGVIVKTPSSEANENVTSIYSNISLKDDGGILMNSKVTNTGIQQEYLLNSLLSISENAKVEWLEERFPQSNHSLLNVDFTGVNPKGNSVSYSYEAEFENYASSSSSRIYVPLKTSNSWNFNPQIQENRDHEIRLGYKFAELDTVLYELPEGYKIESMPDSKIIEEDFGLYEINFTLNNSGNLELNRYLAIKEKTVPAEQYENFRNFFREVSNLDNSQLILVRK